MFDAAPCPCGGLRDPGQDSYDACCGPLLRGERQAATAEELMRSRYTAYAVGDTEHVWRTWHPRTRPERVDPPPGLRWLGLTVVRTEAGGPEDRTGVVEFRARFAEGREQGTLHEVSTFERRGGRWFYEGVSAGT